MRWLILLVVLLPKWSLGQVAYNLKNPADYNNYIMKEIADAVRTNHDYIVITVHSDDYEEMERRRQAVIQQIEKSRDSVMAMPSFEGDTQLRDAAVVALKEYETAFRLDYKEIIGLKKKSKDSYEQMEEYFKAEDRAEEKINQSTLKLKRAQKAYASRYNMSIAPSRSEDLLEEKMERIKAVNTYWRKIFILYFKVSKQYDYMWDALQNQKAGPLDHQRTLVMDVIQEVLPELEKLEDFRGDHEFKEQTIAIIQYYQSVAQGPFENIVHLLQKKSMEQADIDAINNIITKCNADHERLAYNWNIASQDLLRKNVSQE